MTLTLQNLYESTVLARNMRWIESKRSTYPYEVVLSQIPRPNDPVLNLLQGQRVFARAFDGYHWLFDNPKDHATFIKRYMPLVVSSHYPLIIDSHTEASNAMAKMSKKKIAKKMVKPIKVKKPKKLPPGEYHGHVVDYDANVQNPTFKIVAGPTQQEFRRHRSGVPNGISSEMLQMQGAAPLKTKADMLKRISYLETCIDQNNKRHEKVLDAERLARITETNSIWRQFAQELCTAISDGMKEGSLPRRS